MVTDAEGNVLRPPSTSVVAATTADEILASYANLTEKGLTLLQTASTVLETGTALVVSGTPKKYVGATQSTSSGMSTSDEVQTVTEGGSGLTSFTLTYSGQTTTSLVAASTAAQVQAALRALSNIGDQDVTVTGSTSGPYTVTFGGDLANTNVAQMTSTPTGGTGTVTVATLTAGGTGGGTPTNTIVGFLRKSVDVSAQDMLGNVVTSGVIKGSKIKFLDNTDGLSTTELQELATVLHGRYIVYNDWFVF